MKINKFLILIVILIIFFLFIFLYSKKNESNILSSNILFLTQPVFNFSGKVTNIDGNIVTITKDSPLITQAVTFGPTNKSQHEPISKPIVKTLVYKVKIDNNTQIITNYD